MIKMKKIWLIGLVILVFGLEGSFAFIGGYKPGSEPDGFRGIKWGTDISTLKDMEYLRTDPSYGGVEIYKRKGDDLHIGGAELNKIEYHFWRGKLCDVWIYTKGFSNWLGLKDATFEKFGRGYRNPNSWFIEEYMWSGKITGMILKYNPLSQEGELHMFLWEISRQQEAYREQKAKEGAERGF